MTEINPQNNNANNQRINNRRREKMYTGERFKANPFPFAYTKVQNPETGGTIYKRLVSPRVPDRILKTGNRQELEKFYADNATMLTASDKRYLQSRIHTANLLDRLERKALRDLSQGRRPPVPETDVKKGYRGFSKIKLDGPQTSGNGCWSCGMSLLLKSRGIDMSQEEIRAFRPEYAPGEENLSEDSTYILNTDSSFSPYESADLIMKVLPNTAVRNISFAPLDGVFLTGEIPPVGNPPAGLNFEQQQEWLLQQQMRLTAEREQKAKDELMKQQKNLFVSKVRQGLLEDKSPVILNRGNSHYVTITGISEDGERLRIEDSFQGAARTQYVKVDDLMKKYLSSGMLGLGLTWIKDLPVPEKGLAQENEAPEQQAQPQENVVPEQRVQPQENEGPEQQAQPQKNIELIPDMQGAVQANADGEIIINEPGAFGSVARDPKGSIGQIKGQEVGLNTFMDQTQLSQEIGGYLNGSGEDANGNPLQMLATENVYVPRRVREIGDPALALEVQEREQQEEQAYQNELQDLLREDDPNNFVIEEDDPIDEPASGTFDAYIAQQKNQLYQQQEDTAAYISNLYAANVVRTSKEKREADEASDLKAAEALSKVDVAATLNDQKEDPEKLKELQDIHKDLITKYPHLNRYMNKETGLLRLETEQLKKEIKAGNRTEKATITAKQQKTIETMAKLAMPVVKDMLGELRGSTTLPLIAVEENQRNLVNKIDEYAQKNYYIEPNPENAANKPDWTEKDWAMDNALERMRATGLGKNYFGVRRDRNSDEYNEVLAGMERYSQMRKEGKTPSGMQNRELIQKGLDYVKGKEKVRSTKETGQVRFDSVMSMLHELMPPKQYSRLLKRINQKRDAKPGDKNYVDEDTYAPKTADRVVKKKLKEAANKTGSEFRKLTSEALAVKMFAQNNPRKGKTIVEDPLHPELKTQMNQRARELRNDPNFRSALSMFPAGNTQQSLRSRTLQIGQTGEGLLNSYNFAKEMGGVEIN